MWSSYSVFTISVNNHLAYYNLFSPKKLLYVFIFSQTCFLLINIFKEVIPLFVFSFVYPRVSPLLFIYFILFHSFYHLFYFILLLLILMFFSPFPPLSSLFLTFQEVDMTALQFTGPSFPLSSSYHPSYYFYLLTPLILTLTLFWGWHSCFTVCQSLNTYSFNFFN